jgi:hypothetical protein
MTRPIRISSVLLATVLICGCGSDNPSPNAPTPVSITEASTGTLTVNGASTFQFAVQQTGSVTATLTTLSDVAATVGLSLGTFNVAGACQIIIANDNATQGITVAGTATATGTFCARLYDVGKLTAPVDYQISVTHY